MPNRKSAGGTQPPHWRERDAHPCTKRAQAHGDGNLQGVQGVPEQRPYRCKVLPPTSAPEGGTRPEALQGGHATARGRHSCNGVQSMAAARMPQHSSVCYKCCCAASKVLADTGGGTGGCAGCLRRNPLRSPPFRRFPSPSPRNTGTGGGGISRASLLLLLRVDEADADELAEGGRSSGPRFASAGLSSDEASDNDSRSSSGSPRVPSRSRRSRTMKRSAKVIERMRLSACQHA